MLPIAVAALICATLFAGIAAYITLVEHPVRLALPDGPALAQWRPSYARALPLQSGLAILGGVTGLIAWYQTSNGLWLAGSIAILSNWPFTLIAMLPTNTLLKTIAPGADGRALLEKWGRLHAIRSVLGTLAATAFAAACVQS